MDGPNMRGSQRRKGSDRQDLIPGRGTTRDRRRTSGKWEKDQRKQRAIVILGIIALLIIVALPVYGYYRSFVMPPNYTVVRVNDVKYNLGYLVRLLRMEQRGYQEVDAPFQIGSLPFDKTYALLQNELIRQVAPGYGLAVTSKDIDDEIRSRILGTIPDEEETSLDLDDEFAERYKTYLNKIDFSESEHRRIVSMELYTLKMIEFKGKEVPSVQPQAHWHQMIVEDAASAEKAISRYNSGESFSSIVEDLSTNSELIRKGGDMGWTPEGVMPETDGLFFNTDEEASFPRLALGEISEAMPLPNNTLVIYMVSERADAKEVDGPAMAVLKTRALQKWMEKEIAEGKNDVDLCIGGGTAEPAYTGPFGLSLTGCDWVYSWVVKQLRASSLGVNTN